jgi:hypothetical protein
MSAELPDQEIGDHLSQRARAVSEHLRAIEGPSQG